MNDFKSFAKDLNAQSAKISSLINNLNSFSGNLDKNNATITSVLNNADATTKNLSKINFEATVSELKKTLDDLQLTLQKVNSGNGSLGLLMNDDKLYKNLKNTLSTANNLLYDINARPSRYINVSIFGKKQKIDCPPQAAPNSND
jgi:phospholipid/cholesterol/gamma-HCH transport system substrate-binding protein